jgi:putative membrane protein
LSVRPEVGTSKAEETRDAARRTRLANERTYLAWWRTGLTSLAVCVALGRIVPGVSDVTSWPYQVVGAAYGAVGVGFMLVAHWRVRMVERAVDRGDFARLDERISLALLLVGFALGVATIALVVFAS